MSELLTNALKQKILPAIVFNDAADVLPVAEAFFKGGLNVIEIPMRTSIAAAAITAIRKNFPEMYVGAGTLLNVELLQQAIDAGAQFGLSAGLNPKVCKQATGINFPFIPGVMTPSEIEQAADLGYTIQKLFPINQIGGAAYLKAMLGPYEQLDIQFIPMGGINISNIRDYLKLKNVTAVGGSWVASKEMMTAKNYKAIEQTVVEALQHTSNH